MKQLSKAEKKIRKAVLAIHYGVNTLNEKCFSGYVVAHMETLRDEINSSFENLKKEIGLIYR